MANPEALAAIEGVKTVTHPTATDWLISACGAAAGVMIVSAFRHAVIAGALIALALVPPLPWWARVWSPPEECQGVPAREPR